jgi:hypothetical protein
MPQFSGKCNEKILPQRISFPRNMSIPHFRKRKKRKANLPLTFPVLVSLGGQNLTAVIRAASLASSVGHYGFTALRTNGYAGSRQLPVAATARIATGLRHFTLRDSHG